MAPASNPTSDPPLPGDLFRRLLRYLGPGRARFIVLRSHDEAASAALIGALLDRFGGEGRVVLHPSIHPPMSYLAAIAGNCSWRVIPAATVPGSFDQAARALCCADAVVALGPKDALLRALWLPPSILEGFAQLHPNSHGVLVVDNWHSLAKEYLGGFPVSGVWDLDTRDLDPVLVQMFQALSEVHFVIVTRNGSPTLDSAADAILEVGPRSDGGSIFEVRLVKDTLEGPPQLPYVFRLGENGLLAPG